MKKLTSNETFSFRVDGVNVLEISPEGCVCTDEQAVFVKTRFGGLVTIHEAKAADLKGETDDAEKAAKEAEKAAKAAEKEAAKAAKEAEKANKDK